MFAVRTAARSRIAATVVALTVLSLVPLVVGTAGPAAAATRCPSGARNVPHRSGRAPRVVGWLHSCRDGTIRTSKGQKIRLEGLEFFGAANGATWAGKCDAQYSFPAQYTAPDIRKWGFNTVELFVSWQNLEPNPPTRNAVTGRLVHHYSGTYLKALNNAIGQFRQAGVAVVLVGQNARWSAAFQNIDGGYQTYPCGKGMPAWIYTHGTEQAAGGGVAMVNAVKNFFQNRTRVRNWPAKTASEPIQTSYRKMWRFVARHYRRNSSVVGILPMWEPYDILTRNYDGTGGSVTREMLHLAPFFERVGAAIHRVNPRTLVIFPEQKSRRTGRWSLTRRPRVPNGVMGGEFYAKTWATDGVRRMRLYKGRAKNWHYPFDVDEFDAFGMSAGRPHTGWAASTKGMLAYSRRHQISWGLFAYGVGPPGGTGWFQLAANIRQAKSRLLSIIRNGF